MVLRLDQKKQDGASYSGAAASVDRTDILRQLDRERRCLFHEGSVGEVLAESVRVRGIDGDWHAVAWSSLAPARADRVIQETVGHYRKLGASLEWTAYSHDTPPDLLDRLAAHGFEIGPKEVVVVLDLDEPPDWVTAPSGVDVVRVADAAELELFAGVAQQVSGDRAPAQVDAIVNALGRALELGSTQHLGYVVLDGQRPVSIGRLYTHPESSFGGLYGGATLTGDRGRGFYRAGVARRARDARELGARYLRVDALPTSLPILERLGFIAVAETWPCTLRSGAGA